MKEVTRRGAYGIAHFEGRVLLVHQKKGPLKGLLDLPGGGIDPGETPEDALKREFHEEVSGTFEHSTLFETLFHTHHFPDLTYHLTAHIFLVYGFGHKLTQETPELVYDWFPLKELPQLSLTPVARLGMDLFKT